MATKLNKYMKCLVTGSHGLVGSETVKQLCDRGYEVVGIDNNTRAYLFGDSASTMPVGESLLKTYKNYNLATLDIRDSQQINLFFESEGPFDLIVHTAAQPAHEWSTDHALEDFEINATGTMVILEAYRRFSPEAVFIHVSSSKVYGDTVNELPLREFETRYDLPRGHRLYQGMTEESQRLDGNLHSLFGASKAAADIMAKEYGTYFKLPINIFRPVCISGSAHQGTELHGYLAYLAKCIATGREYTVNGYKGKQVRDNIHGSDLARAFITVFDHKDRIECGKAYNIGGGRASNNSMMEAIAEFEQLLGKKGNIKYSDKTRRGDHMWCIFDATLFQTDCPEWELVYDNAKIMQEIASRYQ